MFHQLHIKPIRGKEQVLIVIETINKHTSRSFFSSLVSLLVGAGVSLGS